MGWVYGAWGGKGADLGADGGLQFRLELVGVEWRGEEIALGRGLG